MKSTPDSHEEDLQKAERIAYLIAGHINDSLTLEEREELDDWVTESDENLELFEKLTDEDNIEIAMHRYLLMEKEKEAALAGVKEKIGLEKKSKVNRFWPYLIAASILFFAVSIYLFTRTRKQNDIEKPIVQNQNKEDLNPGSDKAVLTLSDGRTIILDSPGKGLLTEDKGVQVIREGEGILSYSEINTKSDAYNILATPRGGQYKVILPDGSRVYLNAESSLRYPISFAGNSRNVELKGEGYFEVTKDNQKPFSVSIINPSGEQGKITVLGTRFNINAYEDESSISAVLLEGSVKVEKGNISRVIKPGEKAVLANDIDVTKTDANDAIAWKEGKFLFRDASIKSIGGQLKRWYDLEVEYQVNNSQHFNAEVARDVPLSKVLNALEGTGQVHFTLEGRKLIIKP